MTWPVPYSMLPPSFTLLASVSLCQIRRHLLPQASLYLSLLQQDFLLFPVLPKTLLGMMRDCLCDLSSFLHYKGTSASQQVPYQAS